jgi:hypothetical protein
MIKNNKLIKASKYLKAIFISILIIIIIVGFISINTTVEKPKTPSSPTNRNSENFDKPTEIEKIKLNVNQNLPYKNKNFEIIPPSYETRGNYIIYINDENDKQKVYEWFKEHNLYKNDLHITWINKK